MFDKDTTHREIAKTPFARIPTTARALTTAAAATTTKFATWVRRIVRTFRSFKRETQQTDKGRQKIKERVKQSPKKTKKVKQSAKRIKDETEMFATKDH